MYRYEPKALKPCAAFLCKSEGEHLALIGPNGCGNHIDQALQCAAYARKRSCHRRRIKDGSSRGAKRYPVAGGHGQNPDHQIVGMTVEDDVAFGPENLRLTAAEIKARVAESLSRWAFVGLAGRNIENLSGGEKTGGDCRRSGHAAALYCSG